MIISSVTAATGLLAPIFGSSDREIVAVVHLDEANRLLGLTIEGQGDAASVELTISAILKCATRIGSAGLIVSHNHPSGDPKPSDHDCKATRALVAAGRHLNIRLHDHLVFGDGMWSSFRALGLL